MEESGQAPESSMIREVRGEAEGGVADSGKRSCSFGKEAEVISFDDRSRSILQRCCFLVHMFFVGLGLGLYTFIT